MMKKQNSNFLKKKKKFERVLNFVFLNKMTYNKYLIIE